MQDDLLETILNNQTKILDANVKAILVIMEYLTEEGQEEVQKIYQDLADSVEPLDV